MHNDSLETLLTRHYGSTAVALLALSNAYPSLYISR